MDQELVVFIVEKSLMALMTGFIGLLVKLGGGLVKSFAAMNLQLAVIIERIAQHEKRIGNLEDKP